MAKSPESHSVRHHQLPSGKSVEVVYFDQFGARRDSGTGVEQPGDLDLHICVRCDSELVYPLEWYEASETAWNVTLRCPDCEMLVSGVYEQETVDRFDATLDLGTKALVDDLARLSMANIEDEIDRFAVALEADLILPEDF